MTPRAFGQSVFTVILTLSDMSLNDTCQPCGPCSVNGYSPYFLMRRHRNLLVTAKQNEQYQHYCRQAWVTSFPYWSPRLLQPAAAHYLSDWLSFRRAFLELSAVLHKSGNYSGQRRSFPAAQANN